jgi:hypothetical protein
VGVEAASIHRKRLANGVIAELDVIGQERVDIVEAP